MDFRLGAEELELAQTARKVFAGRLHLRRGLDSGDVLDQWRELARDGWLSIWEPGERLRTDTLVMLALVAREAGRVLAGDAFVNNAVLLPLVLGSLDAPELAAGLAEHPGFLSVADGGEAFAPIGGVGTPYTLGVETGMFAYVVQDGVVGRYSAESWTYAPYGCVGLGAGAISLREGATPERDGRFAGDPEFDRSVAILAHAATLAGLAEVALEDTTAYALTRHQFGGPIGRFQAVKHGLADVAVLLEIAWDAVMYAACHFEGEAISIAYFQSARCADEATRAMTQFFGGVAITWEHHAHLLLKTAQLSLRRFGTPREHLVSIARRRLGS